MLTEAVLFARFVAVSVTTAEFAPVGVIFSVAACGSSVMIMADVITLFAVLAGDLKSASTPIWYSSPRGSVP